MNSTDRAVLLVAATAGLWLASCKSTGHTTNGQGETAAGTGTVQAGDESRPPRDIKYRLIVSFISRGAGTDLDASKAFRNYLAAYKEKTGTEPASTPVAWGREGEVDFCFTLSELDAAEQARFIDGMREKLGSSDLVQFAENETCSHQRP